MKNPVVLLDRDTIHRYTRGLWRSDIFKASHDSGGIVYRVIEHFARQPRFFYEPSHEEIEAPHFSPWWSGIQLRAYAKPAVGDLYHLHEIEHAGTMPYMRNLNRVTFKNKIRDNEHEASTLSEMTVYLHHPELRLETFPHAIFIDRFLFPTGDHTKPDRRLLERWHSEPDLVRKELMYARASVITSAEVTLEDPVAFWLQKFANQGRVWVEIWSNRYQLIEDRMIEFREECIALGREAAMDRHIAWLLSDEIAEGTGVPFCREAMAFEPIYAENKRLYRESMERKSEAPVSYVPTV